MSEYQATTALRKISSLIADNANKHTFVICGGQGSSKTTSILMLIINHCLCHQNTDAYVISAELSKMKVTVIKDFRKIMEGFGLFQEDSFKADVDYIFNNGSHIRFLGMDKADIGKGLRSDLLFANEANKMKFETFREISARAKITLLDYNPNFESWIERIVIPNPDTAFLRLTFRDNEFCPENEVKTLLSYKEAGYNADGTIKNEWMANLWQVYGCGMVGRAIGAVFPNWKVGEFKVMSQHLCGLDFGYNEDPDALIEVSLDNDNKIIYLRELLYQNKLSTTDLAKLIKQKWNGLIIADSAAGRTISDLYKEGIYINSAVKDQVVNDIKKLQGYQFVVDENSSNLQMELNNYIWLDKESKQVPIDKYNHLLDAMRYATMYAIKHNAESEDEIIIL